MSNSGSSPPEISEEHDQDDTHETNEEQDQGHTHNNDEEQDQGNSNTQEKKEKQSKAMGCRATYEDVDKIYKDLVKDSVSKIILTGEAGTGKTWIARQIYKLVLKKKHDKPVEPMEPIWICLDKDYDEQSDDGQPDDRSLYDTIARQFSLPTSADAREDNEENEKREGSEAEKRKSSRQTLKEEMTKKLHAATPENFVLMVLDGQLDPSTENGARKQETEGSINKLLFKDGCATGYEKKFKVLITRRSKNVDDSEGLKFEVQPLSGVEAVNLFKVSDAVSEEDGYEKLKDAIQKKEKVLPAEILILAGTLNYIAKDTPRDLKPAIEAATNDLRQLLRYTYDKEPGDCLIDCFWHSWQFLEKHGGVHFNELITNWIMEGYIKPTNQIEKAYEKGHKILMQLIDCHMLKMQEDNVIVMEGTTLKMKEYCRRAYSGTADPGLASVLKDCEKTVLEGITPAYGMMKTLCSDEKEKMISSLLIDGNRLCREVHEAFFGAKGNLKLLAILYPRLESLDELSISKMKELHVLMLRGAYLLKNVDQIVTLNLKYLTVLEISGSTSLKKIPEEFFHEVSRLCSLKLSALGIESLPDCFSKLIELRRLILSECSSLENLPKLDKFNKLEVIDLSGCTNLKRIQEKSFKSLEKLQVIDFSRTKIEKLPIVRTLENLKILLLKGCSELAWMRTVKDVSNLKVLDLSGSVNVKEIMYDSFDGATDLRELYLSETQIRFLPSDLCNNCKELQKLRLKDCSSLKDLPELKELTKLEELDLSGCKSLQKLPDLTALQNLKILSLEGCTSLESLPELKSLSKLEKLYLGGTQLWSKDVEESLNHIPRLEILK